MKIPMAERRVLTKHFAKEYQRSRKGEKGKILDRFVEATGYHRVYAAWLLRNHGRRVWVKPGLAVKGDVTIRPRGTRPKEYGEEVQKPLTQLWKCLGYPYPAAIQRRIQGLQRRLADLVRQSGSEEELAAREPPDSDSPSSFSPRGAMHIPPDTG